jgi:hypothetical protein
MSIKVNVELNNLPQKVEQAKQFAQFALDQQVIKDCNYYVPMDTGNLQRSVFTASNIGQGEIVWDSPYAKNLYYNPQFNFSKDKNPHARGMWFDQAKAVHGKDWTEVAEKAVKQHLGNN